jgi:hypothetical protein
MAVRAQELCMDECMNCALALEGLARCCLRYDDQAEMAPLIALARTCSDICFLTARLLAQESEFVSEYAALCAEVCNASRQELLRYPTLNECQRCAEIALKCDQACQQIAEG